MHRLWGRLIGVVFAAAVSLILAVGAGKIRRALVPSPLGGHVRCWARCRGLLGWYMVASGFAERTDVSQYRLVTHLLLAVAVYLYTLALALKLLWPVGGGGQENRPLRRGLLALIVLLIVTIASGGFVAGLNAGLIYNTFPLMDGRLVPEAYGSLNPWAANLFENHAAVQFNHRLLAIASLAGALALWATSRGTRLVPQGRRLLDLLAAVAALQVALGIATLLLVVPVWLGALHQAGALALLSVAVCALHGLKRRSA